MRKILSMLQEIRQLQVKAKGGVDAQLAEVGDKFRYFDEQLSGITPTSTGTAIEEVMTSADFTYAIQEFIQRLMIPAYQAKRFDFEQFMKPDLTPNFLPVTRYQRRAGLDDLEYVGDKGEARPGSVPDATKRQYKVEVWEKQFDFSMRALVNDDLGYFSDFATAMGQAARASLEKYVSRMLWNATSLVFIVAGGVLYWQNGRLTSSRIAEARMAFNQRVDVRGNPIAATLKYLVHHAGLVDTVRMIRQSTLIPELATNAANVIAGDFVPVEDPYVAGIAPNLPWYALVDWRTTGIVPFVLARRQGIPAPLLLRRKSDVETVTSLTAAGGGVSPLMGDFATGNVVVKIHDEWGTYISANDGNVFDIQGVYYSAGTAA